MSNTALRSHPSTVCHDRTYRAKIHRGNYATFHVAVEQTDLLITADRDLKDLVLKSVYAYRRQIEEYITYRPVFFESLTPIDVDPVAPPIIREMEDASRVAGVGPMAAVAGAIAQYVGMDLVGMSDTVIVENGGDIFIHSPRNETRVGIFAGDSPLSYKVSLKIQSEKTPLCVCTSSGTVGHSLSFGQADAVCVISKSGALADAAATSLGNMVKGEGDIRHALDRGSTIEGVLGIVIIVNDKLGAWGDVELV
ncbi:MAG: UPF0280 family protein [Deltaproteobacteria bacterium]|nr:UPF0280 family protein [Deltaproteobacteria bacterium]MBN2687603.1 UPF0280 family protein [Deltaproteobacteria bacterium]